MSALKALVGAIRTTFGFWVFIVGAIVLLNATSIHTVKDQSWYLPALTAGLVLIGAVLTWLQFRAPEVLANWEERNAERFGDDLRKALDGIFANLETQTEAERAWQELAAKIRDSRGLKDPVFIAFRQIVADRLEMATQEPTRRSRARQSRKRSIE